MDLNEVRKNLDASLGNEVLIQEYYSILRRSFTFKSPIAFEESDSLIRELLTTPEQIHWHNMFSFALHSEPFSGRSKMSPNMNEKHYFESAQVDDYIQPSSPSNTPPEDYKIRSAASELFIPDAGFIATKIALAAWDCKMEGAEDNVTELMVHACQVFIRNIITAMTSKIKRYKVRDGRFQCGFNTPIPNPFLFNYKNVMNDDEENQTEVVQNDDSMIPKMRPSLEKAEQEHAFGYACMKKRKVDNVLSLRVLYHTLKDNPKLLGSHEVHSLSLLKLSLLIDP